MSQGHDIWCSSTEGAYGLSATQITREYCAGMCVQREECKSFDHRRRDGRCCLNMENAASVVPSRDFKPNSDYAYFEKRTHAAGGGCTADQSAKSCSELRWFVTGRSDGGSGVCAQSNVPGNVDEMLDGADPVPACNAEKTFAEALRMCTFIGARLCTLDEIVSGETRGSGCQFNDVRIWTSSRQSCSHNEIMTTHGGGEDHGTAQRNPDDCQGKNSRHAVRCCGDAEKSCPEGTPCHPSGSLLTCSELGWAEMMSASCAREECQQFHGSQGHVCGESDGMTGQCHDDMHYADAAAVCMGAGARLCTAEEIHADDARYTGCNYDLRYVWTSSVREPTRVRQPECPPGKVLATIGSSEFRQEPAVCV